jgi:hypothetical protein
MTFNLLLKRTARACTHTINEFSLYKRVHNLPHPLVHPLQPHIVVNRCSVRFHTPAYTEPSAEFLRPQRQEASR